MLRSFVALLSALTLTVVTVIAAAHAARVTGVMGPTPSAHEVTTASAAQDETCCPKAGVTAEHDALCAFACVPSAMVPAGLASAWHPISRTSSYPRLATGHLPGRTPGLPERPPQRRLQTA